MPVIKSAKKKLRQDKKRTLVNAKMEQKVKDAIKEALEKKSAKAISLAQSLIDKAKKNNIFHKNKAARLKSRIAKTVKSSTEKITEKKKVSKKK